MKMIKKILVVMVAVGVMVLAYKGLDANYKKGMDMCVNAGHSVQYCESHIG